MQLSAHFKRLEFACRCGCGFDTVDTELLAVLESVREHFQQPIHIRSGARCKTHNSREGGGRRSQHLYGKAADIIVANTDESVVAEWLESTYPDEYGIGRYPGRTHIDVRERKTRWRG